MDSTGNDAGTAQSHFARITGAPDRYLSDFERAMSEADVLWRLEAVKEAFKDGSLGIPQVMLNPDKIIPFHTGTGGGNKGVPQPEFKKDGSLNLKYAGVPQPELKIDGGLSKKSSFPRFPVMAKQRDATRDEDRLFEKTVTWTEIATALSISQSKAVAQMLTNKGAFKDKPQSSLGKAKWQLYYVADDGTLFRGEDEPAAGAR